MPGYRKSDTTLFAPTKVSARLLVLVSVTGVITLMLRLSNVRFALTPLPTLTVPDTFVPDIVSGVCVRILSLPSS